VLRNFDFSFTTPSFILVSS